MQRVVSDVHFFRTFDDVLNVLEVVCSDYPCLSRVELAISELMLNAIEHGNLDISFQEKSRLLETGAIIDLIDERLGQCPYKDRVARLEILDFPDETMVILADEGKGFDWKSFLNRDLATETSPNGRGMLMSQQILKTMTYVGNGNKVVVTADKAASVLGEAACVPLPQERVPLPQEDVFDNAKPDLCLDGEHLARLVDEFAGTGLLEELVKEFRRSVETVFEKINIALTAGDIDELYQASHRLKGMCSNIGAKEMLELSVRMEKASVAGNLKGVRALFKQSRKAFERTFERLGDFLLSDG